MKTEQIKFWEGDFGKEYTERNSPKSFEDFDLAYVTNFGISRLDMFESFIGDLSRDIKILEVGCNIGMQLKALQKLGFNNLYGIELQWYAVEKAMGSSSKINIIQGSAFDLPFKDNYFDLVMTNGVLIHIAPQDLPQAMSEIIRCSNNYIMGFEYYSEQPQAVNYRGNEGYLWKADFAAAYHDVSSKFILDREKKYPYLTDAEKGNVDSMFLLKAQG